jgi:hypothetical protein
MSAMEVKRNRLISVRSVVQLYPGPWIELTAPSVLWHRRGFDFTGGHRGCRTAENQSRIGVALRSAELAVEPDWVGRHPGTSRVPRSVDQTRIQPLEAGALGGTVRVLVVRRDFPSGRLSSTPSALACSMRPVSSVRRASASPGGIIRLASEGAGPVPGPDRFMVSSAPWSSRILTSSVADHLPPEGSVTDPLETHSLPSFS